MRRMYPTDLSDVEWRCLEVHVPASHNNGPPRLHSPREILNAIFYIVKSGCAWRLLLHDLEHPGRPSTIILEPGEWMGPANGCTPLYASGEAAWATNTTNRKKTPIRL